MFHDCITTIVNFADHNFDYTQLFKAKDIFICMLLNLLLNFYILLDFQKSYSFQPIFLHFHVSYLSKGSKKYK